VGGLPLLSMSQACNSYLYMSNPLQLPKQAVTSFTKRGRAPSVEATLQHCKRGDSEMSELCLAENRHFSDRRSEWL